MKKFKVIGITIWNDNTNPMGYLADSLSEYEQDGYKFVQVLEHFKLSQSTVYNVLVSYEIEELNATIKRNLSEITIEDAYNVLEIFHGSKYDKPIEDLKLVHWPERSEVILYHKSDLKKYDEDREMPYIIFNYSIDSVNIYREQRQLTLEKQYKVAMFLYKQGYQLKFLGK